MKPLYGFCFMTPFPVLGQASARYQNPNLPAEQRAADLISRMTVEEKVLQMQNSAPAIPRLCVPVYNWWNEALHGVASGRATVFPQAIALGSTWHPDLVHRVGDAISTEVSVGGGQPLDGVQFLKGSL